MKNLKIAQFAEKEPRIIISTKINNTVKSGILATTEHISKQGYLKEDNYHPYMADFIRNIFSYKINMNLLLNNLQEEKSVPKFATQEEYYKYYLSLATKGIVYIGDEAVWANGLSITQLKYDEEKWTIEEEKHFERLNEVVSSLIVNEMINDTFNNKNKLVITEEDKKDARTKALYNYFLYLDNRGFMQDVMKNISEEELEQLNSEEELLACLISKTDVHEMNNNSKGLQKIKK